MMLMQGIKRHLFSEGFFYNQITDQPDKYECYMDILKLFNDTAKNPLNVSSMCSPGKLEPGQWRGPNSVCNTIADLSNQHSNYLGGIQTFVCHNASIIFSKISRQIEEHKSLFVLYPFQVGMGHSIDEEVYLDQIHHVFKLPQMTGIMSGVDRDNAVYLVGSIKTEQEHCLLYHDPHFINEPDPTLSNLSTFHSS